MHGKPRTGTLPVLFVRLLLLALFTTAAAGRAHAQFVTRTWLPWRTIETQHFALHYPADLEEWTRALATRVESIDSAVTREVGYAPPRRTQIVVDNPYAANGSAWPFLKQPVIELWATPPDPREDIGEFRDWGEMLVSHEFTHIAHLVRPSRNAFVRHLWQALPVDLGPIALNAPRWAIEGYATYVEGRVTGSGRPHGAWRAAFLREWAIEGQLPRYDQLDASGAYEGGEFAYLAGSAFLEWLAQRNGDSSLVDIWRRLTARQNRTFDDAFIGVYGETPRALYGRFTADVTERSFDAVSGEAASADTGTIVQRLAWSTGDPAISRDGRLAAIVLHAATAPARVVLWRTAPEPDTGRMRRDSILLARDPEDVPAHPIYPPPRKPLATLRAPGGSPFSGPRFLRDGRILLWRNTPRGDGTVRPDLYIWNPRRGDVRQVTDGASVRDADPLPDGHRAVAAQCLHGWCDIVAVDLASGATATLLPGSPTRSFYRPRVSPDGREFVVAIHDGVSWRLVLAPIAGGSVRTVPQPAGNTYDAAWVDSTTLVAVSDATGIPNVIRIDLTSGRSAALTHASGAAVAPEPNPSDQSIWFLSLYSRGYDLREIAAVSESSPVSPRLDPTLAPVAPLPVRIGSELSENDVGSPEPFGFAPRSFRWIPTPQADADGFSAVLGLVSEDLIGRSEVLGRIGVGDAAAWRGASVDLTWRGRRPAFRLELFGADQHPTANRSDVAIAAPLDARLLGAEFAVDGQALYDTWQARYRIGISTADAKLASAGTDANRTLLSGDGGIAWTQRGIRSAVTESLTGSAATGEAFGSGLVRGLVSAGISTSGVLVPIAASASYGRTNASAPDFERFALGGSASVLVDRTLLEQRIGMPALPTGAALGTSVATYRVAVNGAALSPYFWSGSTADGTERFANWHRVVGLDWVAYVPTIAVAGTPAARALLGVGESLDAPLRKRVQAYVSVVLHP